MDQPATLTNFVCVGPGSWGRGDTPPKALSQMKRNMSSSDLRYSAAKGKVFNVFTIGSDMPLEVTTGMGCWIDNAPGSVCVRWDEYYVGTKAGGMRPVPAPKKGGA